jgi:hypothetical protein
MSTKAATYWGPAMTKSQYAVFPFDVKTMMMREGEPIVFESQAEAERYCENLVAKEPGVGCRILDRDGKTVRTLHDAQVYDRFHGEPAAKRSLLTGIACLLIAVALIGLDWHFGLRLIFGVFLGVRFLWVAAVKLIDGFTGLQRGAQ